MYGEESQAQSGGALRRAEALLISQSIPEVREVELKTKAEIEGKQQQLKQLVGSSYRDLISGADQILEMALCCDRVLANISNIQEGLGRLTGSTESHVGAGKAQASRDEAASARKSQQRAELHALGSRVRFLVDTPEAIWGALDAGNYLEATLRFLRASSLHEELTSGSRASAVAARFPLLRQQWPLVANFRVQIASRINQRLSADQELPDGTATVACTALALLEGLTSAQVLEQYLTARQRLLTSRLAAGHAAQLELPSMQNLLVEALHGLQDTVNQAGLMFLPMETDSAMVQAEATRVDTSSSALLFGGLPGSDLPFPQQLQDSMDKLQQLGSLSMAEACSTWLSSVIADLQQQLPGLLAGCQTAAQLTQLESAVHGGIAAWHKPVMTIARPDDDQERAASSWLGDAPAAGQAGMAEQGWETVSEMVLGHHLLLWDEILEQPFIQRCQQSLLPATLHAALSHSSRSEQSNAGEARKGDWRSHVVTLQAAVLDQLQSAVTDTLLLLGLEPQDAKEMGSRHRQVEQPPGQLQGQSKAGARLRALESCIQDACTRASTSLVEHLAAQLSSLSSPASGPAGAQQMEQALLIGRLCTELEGSQMLWGVVQGSPQDWQRTAWLRQGSQGSLVSPAATRTSVAALQRMGGSGPLSPPPVQPSSTALHTSLRDVAGRAYGVWAEWAASALAADLLTALQADAALSSSVVLRSWEEVVVADTLPQEEGAGGEMRFWQPAAPSPSVLALLLAACREAQRAGGPLISQAALRQLCWHLSSSVEHTIRGALAVGSELDRRLSEKGILQLLFDVRFLRESLSGGRPHDSSLPPAPPVTTPPRLGRGQKEAKPVSARDKAAAARDSEFAVLEASLQERLDPIDWATYEAYLWRNETTCYQRCSVLFGALFQLNWLHGQAAVKAGPPSLEANVMRMAPPAPRFAYLPISTPAVPQTSLRRMAAAHPAASHAAAAAGLSTPDSDAGDFSFAGLESARVSNRGVMHAQRSESSGSTIEALQSRFTSQRLGFGSLSVLGDKAAEVTAMAQQSFGDLPSFPSGLTSGFTGASGLLAGFRGFRSGTDA
ncbi:hypothetical protein WJX84_005968 [Apatococcus fuscideae]|uniref:Conserved oligomeric Golgi complex subunit 1 n=1 Tax=Apatococcus fuscideae TaxID=2026836 RepID=A0AAW1T735_9CHLO